MLHKNKLETSSHTGRHPSSRLPKRSSTPPPPPPSPLCGFWRASASLPLTRVRSFFSSLCYRVTTDPHSFSLEPQSQLEPAPGPLTLLPLHLTATISHACHFLISTSLQKADLFSLSFLSSLFLKRQNTNLVRNPLGSDGGTHTHTRGRPAIKRRTVSETAAP